jgi:hypothetical protein
MNNEEIKLAANSIIAMRNKPKREIDRIDKQLERKELKDSKYALRVEIDKTKAAIDDENLLKESCDL